MQSALSNFLEQFLRISAGVKFCAVRRSLTGQTFDSGGNALDITAPCERYCAREKESFTRDDGSAGGIFEAIFGTNPIDTVFACDRSALGIVINDKGFGAFGDLAAHLSNNLPLNDVVKPARRGRKRVEGDRVFDALANANFKRRQKLKSDRGIAAK